MLITWARENRPLLKKIGVVFLVAIAVRVIVLLWLYLTVSEQSIIFGDTTRYLTLADNTLAGVGYVYDGILETFRLPGYPAFLMLLRILHLPLIAGSLIQIVFASGIAVWAMWFARVKLKLSEHAAFFVGIIAAVEPIQVYYSVILLPDVFFTVAFLVAITYAMRWIEAPSVRDAVIVGMAIGIGNYFRPAMLYLPIFIAVMFLGRAIVRKTSIGQALTASLIIAAVSFAILSPWYVRNKIQFDHFELISMREYMLYVYGAGATDASYRNIPYETAKQELLARARAEAPDSNIATFANGEYYGEKAREIIYAHPFRFAQLYALGVGTFWTAGNYQYLFKSMGWLAPPSKSISYTMLLGSEGPVVAVKTFMSRITEPFILVALFDRVFWASIFALCILGLWKYRTTAVGWFVLILFAYFSATILSTIIGVEARHRYAVNPIIFAFAVAAIAAIYSRVQSRFV